MVEQISELQTFPRIGRPGRVAGTREIAFPGFRISLFTKSLTLKTVAADCEPADSLAATSTHAVIVGGSALQPDAVLRIDLTTGATETIRAASSGETGKALLSVPEAIEFPTERGLTAHAFYYAPHNEGSRRRPASPLR